MLLGHPRLLRKPEREEVFAPLQLLTIDGLLDGTQRAEHRDYEPDLNFKKARAEAAGEQQTLI